MKASKKREAGFSKLADKMEKTVSGMIKKELADIEKSVKGKPRKKRAKKVVAAAPAAK